MAVKTNQYASPLAQDTGRGPSQSIWFDCPVADFYAGGQSGLGSPGYIFDDDFIGAGNLTPLNAISNFGRWAAWGDTSCVLAADPQQDGGVIKLSDGANITKNITLGTTAGAFRLVSGATGFPLQQKLWFEARVAVGSITTACRDAFIGLVDNTTTFTTASATGVINTTTNTLATGPGLLGFHFRSTTNPTDVGLAFNVAGGTVQYPTGLQTLSLTVAGSALTAAAAVTNGAMTGFIKLGFVFDPTAGNPAIPITSASSGQTAGILAKPLLKVFVNGQAAPAFLTTTNLQAATFPTTYLGQTISYTSRSATVAGGFLIDWIRVAQMAA